MAFKETLNFDFIGLTDGLALQSFLASHAQRMGRHLRLRVQLRSFDGICRMVENRAGIAIVPASAAKRMRRAAAIHILQLKDAWALRRLTICVRSLSELPAYAVRRVEHLRQV